MRLSCKLRRHRWKGQQHLVDANQVRVSCARSLARACVRSVPTQHFTPATVGAPAAQHHIRRVVVSHGCAVAPWLHRGCIARQAAPPFAAHLHTLAPSIYHGRFRICCRAKQLYTRLLAGRDLPFGQKFVLLSKLKRLAGSSGSDAAVKSRCSVPVRMCVPARTKRHNSCADFMIEE